MAPGGGDDVVIMDGSMGRQLCLDGMPQDDLFRQIWSARALVDSSLHHLVVDAHKAYIEAGATLLITNAYGVQPTFYRRAFPEEWEANMLRDAELAARLAAKAKIECGMPSVRIFGCLPPLSESHRPDMFDTFLQEEGKEFVVQTYRNLAKAALKGGSEALMLENMVSWQEAELALEAVKDLGVSLVVSMEGALRDKERNPQPDTAPNVARLVIDAKKSGHPIEALGFSCTEPETILACLTALEHAPGMLKALQDAGIRLSAHANLNDRREAHKKGFDVRSDQSKEIKARKDLIYDGFNGYVGFCQEFVKHGATYVGGCCGCGPAGIKAVRAACSVHTSANKRSIESISSAPVLVASLDVAAAMAPTGVLRVGINTANTLLVKSCSNSRQAEGIVPSLAAELARCLGVDLRYVPFATPGELADAVNLGCWDVAFLGKDATRAATIAFTDPYVEIPCCYLATVGHPTLADVDQPGVRVASFMGTAYGNWLANNLKQATLVQASSRAAALELVSTRDADVLAGVTEHLLEDAAKLPMASKLVDGSFMGVSQAVGTKLGLGGEVECFLQRFMARVTGSGLLQSIIDSAGANEKLLVVRPPATPQAGAKRSRVGCAIRICVLGCGAMGSVYAALLAESGNEVWAVDVWEDHIKAINERGLRLQGPLGDKTVKIKATTKASDVGPCDLVIIATKASGVKDAAEQASKLLKENGVVVTIQNGLGAGDRIAQHIDPKQVLLGIASNFGASLLGPGHAEHKSMKLICLGELVQGSQTERLDRIVQVWQSAGFDVKGFADIHVQVWEKFICNCTFSAPCTVTGMTVGELLDNPAAWRMALTCAREAFAVARAQNIRLAFEDVEAHVRQFGESVRGAKPSMLQDHLAKRRSEIDAINGAVPVEAAKVGMTALANQMLADAVLARETFF